MANDVIYCPKHPDIQALVYTKIPGKIETKCVWCIEREAQQEILELASKHNLQFYPLVEQWKCDCGQKFTSNRRVVQDWREHIKNLATLEESNAR